MGHERVEKGILTDILHTEGRKRPHRAVQARAVGVRMGATFSLGPHTDSDELANELQTVWHGVV